ncbi:MAG: FAD-dependent oxidoreductase [Clostridiaceae bacterium]|nr:NAD(P)/FAD-dependent oxidoreductase [Eubacteriales bacterium]
MRETDLLVVGGGPAGLCAAAMAAECGARVLVLERNPIAGGQLVKQTHMFFGSEKQHASVRGIDIADILLRKLASFKNAELMASTAAVGLYEDGICTALYKEESYFKIKPRAVLAATGAYERPLAFPNNDLPGVYGAGAVQTLMNVYGVKPGERALMVGAGNIGLIVSYQLMQAGVKVVAILDAAPKIGGYLVHAAKIARMGVPILTSHTVKRAIGETGLTGAELCAVDEFFRPIEGTEKTVEIDTMCIAVGLSPLAELLEMRGCEMRYVPQLGGNVPVRNADYETTVSNVFVAGDTSGIEEASAAMVEGTLAGLSASARIGFKHPDYDTLKRELNEQLGALRAGPAGKHIRDGIQKLVSEGERIC